MAKKRDGEVIELTPKQVTTEGDGEEFEDASITRFLVERASGASDATVKVFRAAGSPAPDKSKLPRDQFLYQCGPEDFTEEFLQSDYGAGTYRIRLYGSMGGNYGLIVNRLLEIGPPPRSKMPAPLGAVQPAGVTVNAGDGSEIARAMTQAMAPIVAALTTVLQQVLGGQNSRQQSLAELKELAAIVGLSGGQRNTADPMTQLTSMVQLAKELIGEGGGDGPREPSTGALLMKAIENFAPMLQGKLPGGAPQQPAQLPAPAPSAQPTQQPQGDAVSLALKAQLLVLLNAARAGSEPQVYATLIYENAPDEVLDVLESPQWFAELCRLEPGFATVRPWAEQVRAIVLAAIAQEPEGADYEPGANTGNLTPGQDGPNLAGDDGQTKGARG